jgi:hypothetical protein
MADTVDMLQKTTLQVEPTNQVHSTPTINEPTMTTGENQIMNRNANKNAPWLMIVLAVVIVLSGMGSGYALSQLAPRVNGSANNGAKTDAPQTAEAVKVGQIYGEQDNSKFPDAVEGVLVKGGIDGEGTHHLIRPGGASQYVYLTSSVIDLDIFAGDKVAIRGETFQAQKAGWLMDVGQLKVEELNAASPEAGSPTPETTVGD